MNPSDLVQAFCRLDAGLWARPQGLTLAEMVQGAGVSPEAVGRLLAALDDLGVLVQTEGSGGERHYTLRRRRGRQPLLPALTPAEWQAVLDALILAGGARPVFRLRQLVEQLAGIPAGGPVRRLVKGPPPLYRDAETGELVETWEMAAAARRQAEVHYRTARGAERTETVDPLGTVFVGWSGLWHLVLRDGKARIRTVPADRVLAVQLLDSRFRYPRGFSLHKWFAGSWGVERGPEYEVAIWFDAHPENVQQKVKRETLGRVGRTLVQQPDGTLVYRDRVSGLEELRRWLRGYGQSARVLAPPALRRRMRKSLERYLRRVAEVEAELP